MTSLSDSWSVPIPTFNLHLDALLLEMKVMGEVNLTSIYLLFSLQSVCWSFYKNFKRCLICNYYSKTSCKFYLILPELLYSFSQQTANMARFTSVSHLWKDVVMYRASLRDDSLPRPVTVILRACLILFPASLHGSGGKSNLIWKERRREGCRGNDKHSKTLNVNGIYGCLHC